MGVDGVDGSGSINKLRRAFSQHISLTFFCLDRDKSKHDILRRSYWLVCVCMYCMYVCTCTLT